MSEDEIPAQIDWDITIRSFDTEAHVAHRYMDAIGPLIISKLLKFILVIIETFTRYVEFYPTKDVIASAATDAL